MRQVIQDLKNGGTILEEVPAPIVKSGCLLIRTTRTLVSLGTERSLVEFGKANLLEKARQQPDKVKQTLDKIKTDGLKPTINAVFNKLNHPLPLGYCNVGVVEAVGRDVTGFEVGDRVASNGPHAEYVCVPQNLCAKIPDGVTDDEAAFTVIGSIALEGVRLAYPTLGETVVVVGLGLVGLLAAQLLKANGCRVIGYDFDQQKVDIAVQCGIIAFNAAKGTDPVKFIREKTKQVGADAVVISASNPSNDIIHQSAEMSRKRGRIVLIGVIGLDIQRADFYKKELTFQVSCSYGPGRYEDDYEEKGIDYPLPFVRWTENRNFQTILQLIDSKSIDVNCLISERVNLENYKEIYSDMRKQGSIASIMVYPEKQVKQNSVKLKEFTYEGKKGVIGIIGAGNFTSATVLPNMKAINADIKAIASAGGLSAKLMAKKGDISVATSDYKEILNDKDIDTVYITTRHNLHYQMTIDSLHAGKNVIVEKPLCLNEHELEDIIKAQQECGRMVIVGFNRRFAPLAVKMKQLLGEGPKNIIATMNAGFIPQEVWVQDMKIGGGRIIGEACHYIDLCSYLAGSRVKAVCMNALGENPQENTDNASILLRYENGTNAVINYFANGSKAYSKERIEAYAQEKILIIDNWRTLTGYGTKGFSRAKSSMDKGHRNQFAAIIEGVKKGVAPIPFDSVVNTTRASFACIESLKTNSWVEI